MIEKEGYKLFGGQANIPGIVVRAYRGIAYADYDARGLRKRHSTGVLAGQTPSPEELKKWDKRVPVLIERMNRLKISPQTPLFIRWGRMPTTGRSKNYATGELEKGVSAFEAEYNIETGNIEYSSEGTALGGAGISLMFKGKTPYLVTGKIVGYGSDGEPVLKNAKTLCRLSITKTGFKPSI